MWKVLKVTEVRDGEVKVTEHAKPETISKDERRSSISSGGKPGPERTPSPSVRDPRFRKYGPGGRVSPFTD